MRLNEPFVASRSFRCLAAIDAYVNETNRNADYIIRIASCLKNTAATEHGAILTNVVAGSVVTPRTALTADVRHVCMENLADVASASSGIQRTSRRKKDGSKAPLKRFDDWYAYYLSNVATQCEHLPQVTVPDHANWRLCRGQWPLEPVPLQRNKYAQS